MRHESQCKTRLGNASKGETTGARARNGIAEPLGLSCQPFHPVAQHHSIYRQVVAAPTHAQSCAG
jgi:hypothetical protein